MGNKAYYTLLLILICLGVLLSCRNPMEFMYFRQNGKTVRKVKIESVDGRGSLRIYGDGFYLPTGDQEFYLSITCEARYPGLARDLTPEPQAIRALLNGELMPVEKHWVYFEDNETDKGKFYVRLICPSCANLFALPDSLASPDADLLLLDFSEVVRMGDKAVFTDTVYAIIPERIKYWARRLHESKW